MSFDQEDQAIEARYRALKPKEPIYYLASPYTTPKINWLPKWATLIYRNHVMQRIATKLTKNGHILLEPISMCFYKALLWDLPQEYSYWKRRDRLMIDMCDGVFVCDMPGWMDSVGVTDEIQWATNKGKPVFLVRMDKDGDLYFDKI